MTQPSIPPAKPRASDHFDGQRFHNPGTRGRRGGLLQVLRWRYGSEREPWPVPPTGPHFPAPTGAARPGEVALTFIGHSTFLLRLPGLTVLTDPIWSERCSPLRSMGPRRVRPPGQPLSALPLVDLVLVSHNHYDHMDLPTLRTLAQTVPRAVTTLGNADTLRRCGFAQVEALDWWDGTACGDWQVTATPARHFSRRGLFDAARTLWAGFSLHGPAGHVLFAGDSGAGPHWTEIGNRLGPPDLALLPIGAYEPRWMMAPVHMNPAEAVQAHRDLRARHSIGMHFGTFQLADEPIDAPTQALAAAAVEDFTTLGFGETRTFPLGMQHDG